MPPNLGNRPGPKPIKMFGEMAPVSVAEMREIQANLRRSVASLPDIWPAVVAMPGLYLIYGDPYKGATFDSVPGEEVLVMFADYQGTYVLVPIADQDEAKLLYEHRLATSEPGKRRGRPKDIAYDMAVAWTLAEVPPDVVYDRWLKIIYPDATPDSKVTTRASFERTLRRRLARIKQP